MPIATYDSVRPELDQLEKPVKQLVEKYLASDNERDVSLSGVLNWFSVMTRGDRSSSAFKDFLLERDSFLKKFRDAHNEVKEKEDSHAGVANDAVILGVANDLVAQIEMAANFRRLKASHHFAKTRYNLVNGLGKGYDKEDAILYQYTINFLEDAVAYISGR